MKEITEAEFEEHIREVIAGKKSRVKLTEELQTDWRTLNKKIQLLSIENPELYRKFIEKCSYKPREILVKQDNLKAEYIIKYTAKNSYGGEVVGIDGYTFYLQEDGKYHPQK